MSMQPSARVAFTDSESATAAYTEVDTVSVVLDEDDGYRVHFGVSCGGALGIGECDSGARLHAHRVVLPVEKVVVTSTLPRNLRMLQCKKADPGPRARGPLGA